MTTIIDDDSTTEDSEFVFCQYDDEVEITHAEILKNFGYSIVFNDDKKEWSSY